MKPSKKRGEKIRKKNKLRKKRAKKNVKKW